eukprot:1200389-Pyramimonas_sp.AAC.1
MRKREEEDEQEDGGGGGGQIGTMRHAERSNSQARCHEQRGAEARIKGLEQMLKHTWLRWL